MESPRSAERGTHLSFGYPIAQSLLESLSLRACLMTAIFLLFLSGTFTGHSCLYILWALKTLSPSSPQISQFYPAGVAHVLAGCCPPSVLGVLEQPQ